MLLCCVKIIHKTDPGLSCDWKIIVSNVYNKAQEGSSVKRATSEAGHACKTGSY